MPFLTSSYARTGRFQEIYPVGNGAAGQVYHAIDNLGRHVAVKEALPNAEGFAALRAKFEKEARIQAQLSHPNIVRVYHLEQDPESNELYLICEFADAGSLAQMIEREGSLPETQAIKLTLDLCAALEETERLRIVHRDIKPSNILLFRASDGGLTAKLSDFGIAQDTRQRRTTMLPGTSHPGTPLYMAPEQADATLLIDTRADIFALGITLWEILTREDYKALLRDDTEPALTTFRPASSAALGQVIACAAQSDRNRRYQNPRDFAADLRRLLAGESLAPQTIHALPQARSAQQPITWMRALGPAVFTIALLLSVSLVSFGLFGLFGFFNGGSPASRPPMANPVAAALAVTASPIIAPTSVPTAVRPIERVEAPFTNSNCLAGAMRGVSESRPVGSFSAIEVSGYGGIEIRQGDSESLVITGDANLMPLVSAEVVNGVLQLGTRGCVQGVSPLYSLTVRNIASLTIMGATDAHLDGITVESLELQIDGSGTIAVSGQVERLRVVINGAGRVEAQGLASTVAAINIGGTGSVSVAARDSLDVSISGAGRVVYSGAPVITRSISGVGSLQSLDAP